MRSILVAALVLALSLATPAASASSSRLDLAGPGTAADGEVVQVHVKLVVEDVLCAEDRTFTVALQANGDGQASGTLEANTASFAIPARSYFVSSYEAETLVNVTLAGNGLVEIVGTFAPEEGVCFAPGGIPASTDAHAIRVGQDAVGPFEPAPTEPTPTEPTPSEPTPSEPTPSEPTPTEPTPTEPTAEPTPSEPTPQESASPPPPGTCAPEASCGYIGDYDGAQVGSGARDAPGAGVVAAVLALAFVAMLARKKR